MLTENRHPILTVTPNPAYDVTYVVPRIDLGAVHRVAEVRERAGGKGINVARVLGQLGVRAHALGFGDNAFAMALRDDGIDHDLVEALPRVRRTLVVRAEDTTSFWEPGATLADGAEDELCRRVEERLTDARGVVVSGSLPSGADPGLPARLARLAVAAGVPVVVDTHGEPLRRAAQVPGVVLMPNTDELADLATDADDWKTACDSLVAAGVRAVVATHGADGMSAVAQDASWHASPPERIAGNPTGAGDAAAAATIAHLSGGHPDWPALLAEAVATSGAAVTMPAAGEIDHATRERLRPYVTVRRDEELQP
ncbi:MAG TPA: hexose kinase [Nocardioidaceae bacterium]|nr:hexose kinase [Nocardioidaceae bacterium]